MKTRKRKVPDGCVGCQSFYSYCAIFYIGPKNTSRFLKKFRIDFCPCSKCLVKTMCDDPKITTSYAIASRPPDKCKILREAVDKFYAYAKHAKATTTSIRRRNRKLKLEKRKERNKYAQSM